MKKVRIALIPLLALGFGLLSCGGETETEEGTTAESSEEEVVAEEPEAAFAVGDTVWATYFDPEYVTALTWEKTEVVAVEGDLVTVEFQGYLNEGEQATRDLGWIYPYVEVWEPDEAVPDTTVVVEPPGTSFVAYPGVIEKIEEGTYTVGYEIDGIPHTDEFTLEELH